MFECFKERRWFNFSKLTSSIFTTTAHQKIYFQSSETGLRWRWIDLSLCNRFTTCAGGCLTRSGLHDIYMWSGEFVREAPRLSNQAEKERGVSEFSVEIKFLFLQLGHPSVYEHVLERFLCCVFVWWEIKANHKASAL